MIKEYIYLKDYGEGNRIFYILGTKICDLCNSHISMVSFLYVYWNKKAEKSNFMFCHPDCYEELINKEAGIQNVLYIVHHFEHHLPNNIPIVLQPIEVAPSRVFSDVWESDIKEGEKVIDNTVYSKQLSGSCEGASVGKSIEESCKIDTEVLGNEVDALRFLQEAASTRPEREILLEEREKEKAKQIKGV